MRANQASHKVATMCRVLGISTSGYYAWLERTPSRRARQDAELMQRIRDIHATSRGTYGVPRMHAELAAEGYRLGRKRVYRLMRAARLEGVSRRRKYRTTVRDGNAARAPDLVDRPFKADAPNKLWVADITYVPTWAGFLYLAVVLDAWSRRVVGWAMARICGRSWCWTRSTSPSQHRQPTNVIHHSDQGCQYTSIQFGLRCREAGVRPSMGSVGDAYDNAMAESFFAPLECELLDRRRFRSQAEARMAVFEFIEGWYNPRRRHSALDYESPINHERKHEDVAAA